MDDKEEFLKEFGDYYGYPSAPKSIDEIRATEFNRLKDSVYLDHAGATLYSELQMEAIFKDLTTSVYGNPHSQSNFSSATSDVVTEARRQSLGGCNRCQMINFYQQTGHVKKTNEPLATLASYRRVKGKILFGILLRYDPGNKAGLDRDSWLRVGDEVDPNSE